jgi:hypothetical protein
VAKCNLKIIKWQNAIRYFDKVCEVTESKFRILHFPDEAWEDMRLDSTCLNCGANEFNKQIRHQELKNSNVKQLRSSKKEKEIKAMNITNI